LSFFVPKDGNVGPVLNAIQAAGGQTLVDLHLVDMFYDATSGQSVTIQATFQPLGHESFTADQLNGLMTTLVQCATQHHWTLRGSL
jgi:phenylalanyl-tRNA synthetase beta subunit